MSYAKQIGTTCGFPFFVDEAKCATREPSSSIFAEFPTSNMATVLVDAKLLFSA